MWATKFLPTDLAKPTSRRSLFDVVGLRSQKHIHGDITKIPFRILNPGVHRIAVCTSVFSTRLRPGADRDVLKGIAPIGLTGLETTGNRPCTLLDLFKVVDKFCVKTCLRWCPLPSWPSWSCWPSARPDGRTPCPCCASWRSTWALAHSPEGSLVGSTGWSA